MSDPVAELAIHEVDAARWADLERLFDQRGGPRSCWCMIWRSTREEAKHTDGASRRAAMRGRVESGVPVGLLAYAEGEPVAWCSIAPRSTYRRLVDDPDAEEGVWSLACFFVRRTHRRLGVGRRLLDAAVEHARARGAHAVEAYPVDADSPSYRFMGFVPSFERAGFVEIGRVGRRRHVMRLELER